MNPSRNRPTAPRRLVAGTLAGLVAATTTAVAQPAVAQPAAAPETAPPDTPVLALPAPTGAHPVSTRVLELVDRSRPDPWRPGVEARRLVVTLTWPTRAAKGAPPARYLRAAESRAYLAAEEERGAALPDTLPRDLLSRVDTGASRGQAPRPARGGRPLALLSPGFGLPRATLGSLATDLASRGYVVAAVDHVGESSGVRLADGRLVGCAACDTDDYRAVTRGRSRDLSFVLDRLSTRLPGLVDAGRVAVVGHSIGGAAALAAAADDPRVAAAVDLDGTLFAPVPRGLDTPVLLLGTRELHRPGGGDASWDRGWRRLAGPRTWLSVRDSVHYSATDLPLLVEQAGLPAPPALDGRRGTRLTRALVAAFLDRHLRGRAAPLLDDPGARYPEVASHAPGGGAG